MPKKTFKVKDGNSWIEIDPNDVKVQPIQHEVLSDVLLARIGRIYETLREVISYNGNRLCLEAFELMFMREIDPDGACNIWEAIGTAYKKACDYFPEDYDSRQTIYKWLILLVMGAVTEEEKELNEVKIISSCFATVYPKVA